MKELIKKFLINIVFGNTLKTIKSIFKFLKIIYFDYILRLFNTAFETLVVVVNKFSSTIFLLCLAVTVIFCIDFGYALFRTMQIFIVKKALEISPLIVNETIYATTVATYGLKSMVRNWNKNNDKERQ